MKINKHSLIFIILVLPFFNSALAFDDVDSQNEDESYAYQAPSIVDMRSELANIYTLLNEVKPPIINQYCPLRKQDNFTSIPNYFADYFKIVDEDDFSLLKLGEIKQKKLLLLSSYSESGSPNLTFITLSDHFDFLDKLVLSGQYEVEYGFVNLDYIIDSNYRITLKEIEYVDYKLPKLLSERHYIINEAGFFVEKYE
ncbi:hypothetical protein RCS94_06970 [Orbaceae bacterium ac157xtp]